MIDRRVQILEGPRNGEAVAVSDLRSDPFIVLLGEPGIGKTTVLDNEAAAEGVAIIKVRELINETVEVPGGPLFLDGLDEYRVGSSDLDKVHLLAKAIRNSGATRWRLTCRSEDWQKAADIAAIGRTTADAAITVAQILPLNITETLAVLQELGEGDADAFVDRAYAMGASGLLESPLSLKLLRNAVAGGQAWPASRSALFEQATAALAHEDNAVHRLDRTRTSPALILAAARKACLFMLVTGSRFVWRSGALPPNGDARAYLSADALGLERQVIDDMLDSALFRGEGEAFEPIHRSVAEFLGASALAQAIVGDASTAAFPLGRAKALITGADGRAPTDLRGLYAWLAAHLAALGAAAQARELAEADAVSVLVYGDASAFDSSTKQSLLANLDRDDPYFRASEIGATAVGGLADEDLANDFREALNNGDGSHRMITVYEVLTAGRPVLSLRPLLRTIALDPSRPEWQRTRAMTAWLNGAEQPDQARRALFDSLAAEAPSAARESLRAELLSSLPAQRVSVADFTSVIADFQATPDDSTIMRLWGLQKALVADPRPELFDKPFDWLPDDSTHRRRSDVEQLIDRALAAAIRITRDLSGERLWRWLTHARDDKWTNLGDEARPAVSEWIDGAPGRDVELFDAVLATDDSAEGPWVVGTNFFIVAGAPNGGVLDHMRKKAMAARGPAKRRLLEIAVNVARRYDVGADAYWRLHDFLEAMKRGNRRLLKTLTVCEVEGWRRKQQARESRHRAQRDGERETNNRKLRQLIPEMAHGQHMGALSWAAQTYFHPQDKKGEAQSSIERLCDAVDDEVLDAILRGWRQLATHDVPGVNASTLGKAEAERMSFHSENGAIAGLDRLRTEATPVDLATLPLTLAIVVLRSGWIAHGSGSKGELEAWAWDRLNRDPAQGAAALLEFWEAVLASGYAQSSSWQWASAADGGAALRGAVDTMLTRHPAMCPDILRALLASAAPRMERSKMARLAADALVNNSVTGKQRAMWSVAAFATDPLHQGDKLTGHAEADLLELFNERYFGGLVAAFPPGTDAEQAAVSSAIFSLVAPRVAPHVERRRGPVPDDCRLNETANSTLNRLAASSDPSATVALTGLQAGVAAYPAWAGALRHAVAQQARARRDREFVPPDAAAVADALSGRAPLNGADLRAILVDELRRFGRELRTGATSNWRDYWNTDSAGKATDPKIENIARDITLGRLQERLAKYRIAIALPEAQHHDDTRADVLIASGAGRTLPIEAKRHYHKELWTAASGQLQGYVVGDTADGFGILLVFWYGDVASTPPRADGKTPGSAAELEQLLVADLPDELAAKTDVIVLDVSATDRKVAAASAKPRRAANSSEDKATVGKKAPAKRVKAG